MPYPFNNDVSAGPSTDSILDLKDRLLGKKPCSETAMDIASLIEDQPFVDLSNNYLGLKVGDGLDKIFQVLPEKMQQLNLSSNNILYNGNVAPDFKQLSQIQTLQTLSLSSNSMWLASKDDFAALVESLPPNLVSLDISHNDLNDKQIRAAMPALKKSKITDLPREGNNFSAGTEAELQAILKRNEEKLSMDLPAPKKSSTDDSQAPRKTSRFNLGDLSSLFSKKRTSPHHRSGQRQPGPSTSDDPPPSKSPKIK